MKSRFAVYMAAGRKKMIPKTENLLRKTAAEENIGLSTRKTIDRNAYFYHVITQSWTKETIFYRDVAAYRENLLGKLCPEYGLTILFSVVMPNHTHDVFLTPEWEKLPDMLRNLNRNVSRYIRKHYPEKAKHGKRIFDHCPAYVPVKDIGQLFYLGKYIFDNPRYLEKEGRRVPGSCFWMFEKAHFTAGYNEKAYPSLFGLTPQEIFSVYSSMTKEEVRLYSEERFCNWTDEDNRAVFTRGK